MPEVNRHDWQTFLRQYPNAHLLQSAAWGALKSSFDWQATWVVLGEVGAQVLFRKFPMGFSLAYIPKGPVGPTAQWGQLWGELDKICRRRRAICLKVEADLWDEEADQHWGGAPPQGFRLSRHEIQPRRTFLIDLSASEDQILAQMKQKTRYNIRLALKKGVVVCPSDDVSAFYRLMEVTGNRDEFGVHSQAYYQRAYDLFAHAGACQLLFAEFEGQPLAGVMVFRFGKRAWYFYGASSDLERNRMPTYSLQWEAIRWAKTQGATSYDFWGVPDADLDTLEAQFADRADGLWGVYRFKRGFGGELKRAAPAWDRVYQPWLYSLYQWRAG